MDATGRPDESLAVEFVGPLNPNSEENSELGKMLSFSLQKGQLKANICFQPFHSANLEVPELIYSLFLFVNKNERKNTRKACSLLVFAGCRCAICRLMNWSWLRSGGHYKG